LLGAAAWLVVSARRVAGRAPASQHDRLARALRLVRESAGRGGSDRRRALDLLAETLEERAAARVEETTRLAWAAPEPAPEDAVALADEVESALGSRS
jgi:hypothetical protein